MNKTKVDHMNCNHVNSIPKFSLFDVSICIINNEHRDLLPACLDSVAYNLKRLRGRVVVLDNNSHDGSAELLRTQYPHVRLIENTTKRGFAVNQNVMLRREMETARYVMMLNDDTVMQAGCLYQLINLMDNHPRAGAVAAQLQYPDGSLQISATAFPSIWKESWRYLGIGRYLHNDRLKRFLAATLGRMGNREICEYLVTWREEEPRQMDVLCGGALLFRSSALSQVGLLKEGYIIYAEDIDWCRRAWQVGWECWILPSARVSHYGGASSSVFTRTEKERSLLRYFMLYHPNWEVVIFRLHLLALTLLKVTLLPLRLLFGGRKKASDSWSVYRTIIPLACRGLATKNARKQREKKE